MACRLSAAVIGVAVCAAGPVAATTLEQALALAYANNPNLESARAELRQVDERVPQARSGWLPRLFVKGRVGTVWENNSVVGSAETRTPRSASVAVEQPLFRGGRTVAGTDEAENLVLSQRARLASVEQAVLVQTVESFVNVARDEAVLELTANNEQVLGRQLDASNDRFEVGEITRTDVAQSESRLARATAQRVQAQGDLIASQAAYREVVGQYPDTLSEATVPGNLPASEEETVAGSAANPDVLSAEFAERAAVARVDVIFGELLPTLTLNGELRHDEDIGRDKSRSESASMIAELVIPLYQAGAEYSLVREAKERVAQRRQQLDAERRRAAQVATSSWQALETARARILSFQAEVDATGIAVEGVRQEASVGARTVLDILDAEQEYLVAQVSLVRARRDEVVAAFRVLAAVGRMTGDQIGLPVEYYDVERHYDEVRDKLWGVGPSIE